MDKTRAKLFAHIMTKECLADSFAASKRSLWKLGNLTLRCHRNDAGCPLITSQFRNVVRSNFHEFNIFDFFADGFTR